MSQGTQRKRAATRQSLRAWLPTGAWPLTGALFGVLLVLTLALWRAEIRISGQLESRSSMFVLWGGLGISLMMSAAVLQALLHRTRAQEQAQLHLKAIESLNAISTAIGARISSKTVLNELAEAARRMLRMDRAGVCLLDHAGRTLTIVATVGEMPERFPHVYDVDSVPACRQCLQSGEPGFHGNLAQAGRPYDAAIANKFDVVAAVLIPLKVDKRTIGLLTLSSSCPREFTDLDRKMGQLLGSQGSVILSNAKLYEQTKGALDASTRLLRQRQALAAANAALVSSDSVEDCLKQIMELIPMAVGSDLCGLTLLTGNGEESVLVAMHPTFDHLIGKISGPNLLAREAFATRRPVIVCDTRTDPRLHAIWKSVPYILSTLYAPMFRSDGQPLGALSMSRRKTGTFSHEQIDLAQTFAALAGTAVEYARLLEQTRLDADAKTELLRELNHRVKNNLTGIVGLLEMDAPPMPADVRDWLDRATDRIRAMAGAHQMFTGAMERVGLETLISQTLASLSVSKPPGVSIRTELNGVGITLATEQAVGLAMVLHELCYNALVHGLRTGGTLTITARRGNPIADSTRPRDTAAPNSDNVVIEVADDGAGCGEPPASQEASGVSPARPPTAGSGRGLQLVRGLARRELRGSFSLRPGPEGGTVAVVEFPVNGK